jgi:hypothetical protein
METCDRCFKSLSEGEHGEGVCPYEPRRRAPSVIDDQLEGGARFFEHMGPEPVWCENKTQWRREMKARGLRCVG